MDEDERDDLDEFIARRTAKNRNFPRSSKPPSDSAPWSGRLPRAERRRGTLPKPSRT